MYLEAEVEMWIQCPTLHFPIFPLSYALGFSLALWLFSCLSYSMPFLFKKRKLVSSWLLEMVSVFFGLSWTGDCFGRC